LYKVFSVDIEREKGEQWAIKGLLALGLSRAAAHYLFSSILNHFLRPIK
jgi:hypothetical protein